MSEGVWTEEDHASNILDCIRCGAGDWSIISSYETPHYGQATGFVYFIGCGDPYITHVKIGFTRKNPYARMADLQTGCPFKLKMIGFVVGNIEMERELHDVLRDYRREGEWFALENYVRTIVHDQLTREAVD